MIYKCLVCGISDAERPVYTTLDDICSPCFAWDYNTRQWLKDHTLVVPTTKTLRGSPVKTGCRIATDVNTLGQSCR